MVEPHTAPDATSCAYVRYNASGKKQGSGNFAPNEATLVMCKAEGTAYMAVSSRDVELPTWAEWAGCNTCKFAFVGNCPPMSDGVCNSWLPVKSNCKRCKNYNCGSRGSDSSPAICVRYTAEEE